jgi:hypothetical protein
MEDKLISLETAKLAKEKGFNGNYGYFNEVWMAPTQSLLQRWLREVHNIHIVMNTIYDYSKTPEEFDGWSIYIGLNSRKDIKSDINDKLISIYFNTYEEALEKGLLEVLNLLTNIQS